MGGIVNCSLIDDHFMAFIKSFKVDVFLVFSKKPFQSLHPGKGSISVLRSFFENNDSIGCRTIL